MPEQVPKLCGADIELGNFVLGRRGDRSGAEACRAVLREIEGFPDRSRRPHQYGFRLRYTERGLVIDDDGGTPQDSGRRFLASTGGCAYIDLDHLELCIPEVLSAYDHVAAWHAMLRVAREALDAANARQPPDARIQVLVNNSDGSSNSYGSHLNFLLTRQAWDDMFRRKLHQLLYLAAYQASSIVFTGQGKVGAENGAPRVRYQLSQRADFFERLVGTQTTYHRPLVNSRDESLCGTEDARLARLHCIFFDNTLCPVASLLKVGVMQIILAMLETARMNPAVILDEPLDAVIAWSHDPTLRARARLASGRDLTAVELQWLFLEDATAFVAAGGCDGIVPRAGEILACWEDTLAKLAAHDVLALAPRLDWALKLTILERAMARHPGLEWDSPQMKHLDHLYGSLDASEGLYWLYERDGLVERTVSDADIERLRHEPPEDTRAWTRAMVLRAAGPDLVEDVDWDRVKIRQRNGGHWSWARTLELSNPLRFTRRETATVFEEAETLEEILERLSQKEEVADATA